MVCLGNNTVLPQASQSDLRKTDKPHDTDLASHPRPSCFPFSVPSLPLLFSLHLFPLFFTGPMLPYARWRTQSVKILTGGASLALSAVCSSNKDPYALCSARRVTPLLLLRPLPSILSILLPPPTLRSITTEPWMNCEYYYVLHFTTCRSINAEHVI